MSVWLLSDKKRLSATMYRVGRWTTNTMSKDKVKVEQLQPGVELYKLERKGVWSAMSSYLKGKTPYKRKGRPVGRAGRNKRTHGPAVRSNKGRSGQSRRIEGIL